jgi:hypothetical protein
MPCSTRMAHEGILRLQVEDVELVDAGRHDHQRPRMHLRRRRRVLDELDQLVLEDHLARRRRQVAADLEGVVVGHRDAALAEVGEEVLDAGGDAGALRGKRRLDEFRIGRREVGGRHGVDELAGEELAAARAPPRRPARPRPACRGIRHSANRPGAGSRNRGFPTRPAAAKALVLHLAWRARRAAACLPQRQVPFGERLLQAGDGFALVRCGSAAAGPARLCCCAMKS